MFCEFSVLISSVGSTKKKKESQNNIGLISRESVSHCGKKGMLYIHLKFPVVFNGQEPIIS